MNRLGRLFDEEIRFFKGWLDQPGKVGSILPTSPVTSRRIASVVNPDSPLPVLELGPGTGVVTKAILERGLPPEKLVCLEYSNEFIDHLRASFPGVTFLQGDANNLEVALGPFAKTRFDCIISGIPLLNLPMEKRFALVDSLLSRVAPGRPIVQITYGPKSPLPERTKGYKIEKLDFVIRNVPPAHLWLYRRDE